MKRHLGVSDIVARISSGSECRPICSIPGCGRPTALAAAQGLAAFHCRYHVQYKARHGSHWHPTYTANELQPYRDAADIWIASQLQNATVRAALGAIDGLISTNARVEPAHNLNGLAAAERAWIALKRLGKAGVPPRRLLATSMGLWALIEDDAGSHRTSEFREVQIAKAWHRLASGTHKTPSGFPLPPKYPNSSGLVLRIIGKKATSVCGGLARTHQTDVCEIKVDRFGVHPSHLPNWKAPLWRVPPRLRPNE